MLDINKTSHATCRADFCVPVLLTVAALILQMVFALAQLHGTLWLGTIDRYPVRVVLQVLALGVSLKIAAAMEGLHVEFVGHITLS